MHVKNSIVMRSVYSFTWTELQGFGSASLLQAHGTDAAVRRLDRQGRRTEQIGATDCRILPALRSFHFCSLSSNFLAFFFCFFVPIPGLILRASVMAAIRAGKDCEKHRAWGEPNHSSDCAYSGGILEDIRTCIRQTWYCTSAAVAVRRSAEAPDPPGPAGVQST